MIEQLQENCIVYSKKTPSTFALKHLSVMLQAGNILNVLRHTTAITHVNVVQWKVRINATDLFLQGGKPAGVTLRLGEMFEQLELH